MNELHRQKVLKLEYCFQMLNDTFILLSHIDYIVFYHYGVLSNTGFGLRKLVQIFLDLV